MPSGFISFPGILEPIHLVATRTCGVRPDRAVLTCVPQNSSPDTSGQATLSFGFNGVTISWNNALCDRATMQFTPKGQHQIVEILDRRWLWSRAYITDTFNARFPDGSIDPTTQTSFADIVYTLFYAMGEVTPDLTSLISEEEPELHLDHDNVADVLMDLLEPRGFVISLMSDDTVKVWQVGTGSVLPANGDVVNVSITVDPPDPPQFITVCGDTTLVQSKLLMQPLGEDLDGSIRPVADLSYAPTGGWAGTDLIQFSMLANPVAKQLALKTVGRLFGPYSQADGTFNIAAGETNYCPGEIQVSSAWQYLPLEPELLTTYTDVFGKIQRSPPYVEGTFKQTTANANANQSANTPPFTRVDQRDYRFDRKTGSILFNNPALMVSPANARIGTTTFAEVYLTCSYAVHDASIQIKDRYINDIELEGVGIDLRKIDELQRLIIVNYAPSSSVVSFIDDNVSDVNDAAQPYLQAAYNEYVTSQGNLLLYRGIYPFSTDGVALQIRWDVARRGQAAPFGTFVAQNFEGIPQLPLTSEKRHLRLLRMQPNATNRRNKRRKLP